MLGNISTGALEILLVPAPEQQPDRAFWLQATRLEDTHGFYQACQSLSAQVDGALVPNRFAFELLDRIDVLIAEKREAEQAVKFVELRYQDDLAAAKNFGDEGRLSSAHFNAQVWSREADELIKGFEKAQALLDSQLAACGGDDWTPKPKSIAASVKLTKKAHQRYYAVRNVKAELASLLQ